MHAAKHHVHGYWRRHAAALFRWLHIYLSMVSFAILFFFAVTGITLNHTSWFEETALRTSTVKGQLQREWLGASGPDSVVDKLQIVEHLRNAHGIHGALAEFTADDWQCLVSFRGPGYTADASVNRDSGDYELTETRMGFVAIINDLHKGRDTGPAWSWVIDLSAVLMIVVSLTGMVLIFFLKRRRFAGLVAALVGGLVSYLVYRIWVP